MLSDGSAGDELLRRCADRGDRQAWEEFLRHFHPLIMAVVRRTVQHYTDAHRDLCEDLAQQVYLKLSAHNARLLREFVPLHEGACYGFLKVLTANVVKDYFRGKARIWSEPLPPDPPAPASSDQGLLLREMDDLLRRAVRPSERHIFWLHYRQGMAAREIASLPAIRLSEEGVESVLVRLRRLIRQKFLARTGANHDRTGAGAAR